MGNSARGVYTGVTFSTGSSTALGSVVGTPRATLTTPNLPPYTPAGSASGSSSITIQSAQGYQTGGSFNAHIASGGNIGSTVYNFTVNSTFTGTAQGGTSTPIQTISPIMLVTTYLKL
jgi:hypothetical protein